jgi:hypothetical protein
MRSHPLIENVIVMETFVLQENFAMNIMDKFTVTHMVCVHQGKLKLYINVFVEQSLVMLVNIVLKILWMMMESQACV